jgi:hypothetical protein
MYLQEAGLSLQLVEGTGCEMHSMHVTVIVQKLLQHLPDGFNARHQPHQPALARAHALQVVRVHLYSATRLTKMTI